MLAQLEHPRVSVREETQRFDDYQAVMEEDSPFGLQGLARDTCTILKSDRIGQLAATLALSGTRDQIQDINFVQKVLSRHHDWLHEYRVVHLIEKSLWIDGHSDLVMTLLKNPSQIPDNPPEEIIKAMSRAITWHPDSTIWYGVPLFSEETNAEGLPIPLTAAEVRAEAHRRIQAAQKYALRWRWAYRSALRLSGVPGTLRRTGRNACLRVHQMGSNLVKYWKRARRDARNRTRAKIKAHSEFCRKGQSFTCIPEHTTLLGRMAEGTAESMRQMQTLIADRVPVMEGMAPIMTGATPVLLQGVLLSSIAPMMIAPMTIVACDPFLFVELPDEPNKLRFLGHWYWQMQSHGRQKLHLHV